MPDPQNLTGLLNEGTGLEPGPVVPQTPKVSSNGSPKAANGLSVSRSEKIGQLIAALCSATRPVVRPG